MVLAVVFSVVMAACGGGGGGGGSSTPVGTNDPVILGGVESYGVRENSIKIIFLYDDPTITGVKLYWSGGGSSGEIDFTNAYSYLTGLDEGVVFKIESLLPGTVYSFILEATDGSIFWQAKTGTVATKASGYDLANPLAPELLSYDVVDVTTTTAKPVAVVDTNGFDIRISARWREQAAIVINLETPQYFTRHQNVVEFEGGITGLTSGTSYYYGPFVEYNENDHGVNNSGSYPDWLAIGPGVGFVTN